MSGDLSEEWPIRADLMGAPLYFFESLPADFTTQKKEGVTVEDIRGLIDALRRGRMPIRYTPLNESIGLPRGLWERELDLPAWTLSPEDIGIFSESRASNQEATRSRLESRPPLLLAFDPLYGRLLVNLGVVEGTQIGNSELELLEIVLKEIASLPKRANEICVTCLQDSVLTSVITGMVNEALPQYRLSEVRPTIAPTLKGSEVTFTTYKFVPDLHDSQKIEARLDPGLQLFQIRNLAGNIGDALQLRLWGENSLGLRCFEIRGTEALFWISTLIDGEVINLKVSMPCEVLFLGTGALRDINFPLDMGLEDLARQLCEMILPATNGGASQLHRFGVSWGVQTGIIDSAFRISPESGVFFSANCTLRDFIGGIPEGYLPKSIPSFPAGDCEVTFDGEWLTVCRPMGERKATVRINLHALQDQAVMIRFGDQTVDEAIGGMWNLIFDSMFQEGIIPPPFGKETVKVSY